MAISGPAESSTHAWWWNAIGFVRSTVSVASVWSSKGLKNTVVALGMLMISVRMAVSLPMARKFAPLLARKIPGVGSVAMRTGAAGLLTLNANVPPGPVATRKP